MHISNVNPSELKCSQTWKPLLGHHARMSGLFLQKTPQNRTSLFFQKDSLPDKSTGKTLQTSVYVWIRATFPPWHFWLCQGFKYIVYLLLNAYI